MATAFIDNLLLSAAGITAYPPGATFGPRLLYDFEFIWIIDGHARGSFDEQHFEAPPGTILLGRPGLTQRFDWDPHKRTIHAHFHFSFDYAVPGWPRLQDWPIIRSTGGEDILRPLFRYVIGLAQAQPLAHAELLEASVTLMLRSFLSGNTAIALEPHENLPAAIQRALSAIRRALAQDPPSPISLSALAKVACVTPEHLCRLFRRHLNLGPIECVGLARLERAAGLLVRTNLPIRQIADTVGFGSPYHFSHKFHQVYGLSPRDYRISMQSGYYIAGNPVIQSLQLPMSDSVP